MSSDRANPRQRSAIPRFWQVTALARGGIFTQTDAGVRWEFPHVSQAQRPNPKLSFVAGVLAITLLIPALFWLRFGVINAYALAFTAFLLLLVFAIEFIPKLSEKYEADLAARPIEPKWFDRLGVVWLLAIPFAPFLGWLVKSLATLGPANWQLLLGVRSFFCVALPLATVLPLLRYVRGRAAPYALLILFVGTAFPVSTGYESAVDFVRGPVWESLDIARLERVSVSVNGRTSRTTTVYATLADGRVLESNSDVVTVRAGPTRALVLKGIGAIIAVQ